MSGLKLVILGATGSIGESAFRVWEEHRERIQVEGLVAHRQGERLWRMGKAMGASWVALTEVEAAERLRAETSGVAGPAIVAGYEAMLEALDAAPATHLLAAMSGFAGLRPTLIGLKRGMRVMLANKETMVAAGDLVRRTAEAHGAEIVPVDSEHSAIFQCMALPQPVRRIILTCSGGPFRETSLEAMRSVTVEDALRHPNWSMGPKITVDSATLMNKGLEVIEAHQLFQVPYDAIDVVIHPGSVVHSMVEFQDGATLAQCGHPDMRVPIAVALAWPERWPLDVPGFEWAGRTLEFFEPDVVRFPLLRVAREAGRAGGLYPAVLNAANEVAVEAFLARRIPFLRIAEIVEGVLNAFSPEGTLEELEEVLETDAWARRQAAKAIAAPAD